MVKCPTYCKGCIYRSRSSGVTVCQYALMTGKLRGCPADENCIHKTKSRVGTAIPNAAKENKLY